MKIKLQKGRQASEEAILALEAALGYPLSHSFRAFLRDYNGARPESNVFKVGDVHSGVNEFIPVSEILKTRTSLEDIPRSAYPVAWAACGDHVFIDEDRESAVFHLDHEVLNNHTQIAPSFSEFLDLLEPDTAPVQLKPGQLKSVWIDLELLKKLKK